MCSFADDFRRLPNELQDAVVLRTDFHTAALLHNDFATAKLYDMDIHRIGHEAHLGHIECVNWIMKNVPTEVWANEDTIESALFAQDLVMVKWLLSQPNARPPSPNIVEMMALNGFTDMIRFIGHQWPDIIPSQRALDLAAVNGHFDTMRQLLFTNAHLVVNMTSSRGVAQHASTLTEFLFFMRFVNDKELWASINLVSAQYGKVFQLSWALSKNLLRASWKDIAIRASDSGHIEVLKWIVSRGHRIPGDVVLHMQCFSVQDIKTVLFPHMERKALSRSPWRMFDRAITGKNIELLEFLARRCHREWGRYLYTLRKQFALPDLFDLVIETEHLGMVVAVFNLTVPYLTVPEVVEIAAFCMAHSRNPLIVQHLFMYVELGDPAQPWFRNLMVTAVFGCVARGAMETVDWLLKKLNFRVADLGWEEVQEEVTRALLIAISTNRLDPMNWLLTHYPRAYAPLLWRYVSHFPDVAIMECLFTRHPSVTLDQLHPQWLEHCSLPAFKWIYKHVADMDRESIGQAARACANWAVLEYILSLAQTQ